MNFWHGSIYHAFNHALKVVFIWNRQNEFSFTFPCFYSEFWLGDEISRLRSTTRVFRVETIFSKTSTPEKWGPSKSHVLSQITIEIKFFGQFVLFIFWIFHLNSSSLWECAKFWNSLCSRQFFNFNDRILTFLRM